MSASSPSVPKLAPHQGQDQFFSFPSSSYLHRQRKTRLKKKREEEERAEATDLFYFCAVGRKLLFLSDSHSWNNRVNLFSFVCRHRRVSPIVFITFPGSRNIRLSDLFLFGGGRKASWDAIKAGNAKHRSSLFPPPQQQVTFQGFTPCEATGDKSFLRTFFWGKCVCRF